MKTTYSTSITNHQKIRLVNRKTFGIYLGIKNDLAIKKQYENYLFLVNKTPGMYLTNHDIFKIDGVYP